VRNVHLDHEPWTTENGLLTPTMKFKRAEGGKYYHAAIEKMYSEARLDKSKL
jgi:long-chain acyl-CoA synthetase